MTSSPGIPAAVLLHNVRSLYNVGAFFRTADSIGASDLDLSGFTGYPPSGQIARVKKSLNVATAGGVVLYEIFRKYRALPALPHVDFDERRSTS
jgi:tRNA G18 (ribose-2'-O)-methylase SpoU